MNKQDGLSYGDAGVDIDFAASVISEMDQTAARASEVIKSPNDFAGLFSLKSICERFDDPVLVSSTDGVGTKVLAAIFCDRYQGLGQDLVAMCANDLVTKGAEPLFFLDYYAAGCLSSSPLLRVLNSIVSACEEIDCALIGGETAEMPGVYANTHFDLAGFVVGVVERQKILGAHLVQEDDVLIGLASSGLHANGFSLVRKIIFEQCRHKAEDVLWQTERHVCTVADELLKPTKLYVNQVQKLLKHGIKLHAIAHITGGGLSENVPRVIPAHLCAKIDISQLECPPIFSYLKEKGPVSDEVMLRTFNMGLGLVIALDREQATQAMVVLKEMGEKAFIIGEVSKLSGVKRCLVKM